MAPTSRRPARTLAARVVIPVAAALLALGACSDDGAEDSGAVTVADTPTTVDTGSTAPSSGSVPSTTAATPATTGPGATTPGDGSADIPLPPPVSSDLPIVIEVTVGVDADPTRVEQVPLGTTVALVLTDPGAPQEYHVHGYDLGDGQTFTAGQTATFTFTADRPGRFEVESHVTDDVLVILEVV